MNNVRLEIAMQSATSLATMLIAQGIEDDEALARGAQMAVELLDWVEYRIKILDTGISLDDKITEGACE